MISVLCNYCDKQVLIKDVDDKRRITAALAVATKFVASLLSQLLYQGLWTSVIRIAICPKTWVYSIAKSLK